MLYAIQIYLGSRIQLSHGVDIWIYNAEELVMGKDTIKRNELIAQLVLDYDMWKEMNII